MCPGYAQHLVSLKFTFGQMGKLLQQGAIAQDGGLEVRGNGLHSIDEPYFVDGKEGFVKLRGGEGRAYLFLHFVQKRLEPAGDFSSFQVILV